MQDTASGAGPQTTPEDDSSERRLPTELLAIEPVGWPTRALVIVERLGVLPVIAGGVILLAAGVLAFRAFSPPPIPVEDSLPYAPDVENAPASISVPPSVLMVHAAGAVARPGVYELPAGSRIIDVVELAGGVIPEADLQQVNLAAEIADGARVHIPAIGEVVVQSSPADIIGGTGADTADTVDVNTADAAALEELPGVGPATAAAIIEHRDSYGPFAVVDDLIEVRGIGESKLAAMRDAVVLR